MNTAERIAKHALEALHPGAHMDFVAEQSDGQHDFDLVLPDGRVVAVAVTTETDEKGMERQDRLGRAGFPAVRTRVPWIVTVRPEVRVARLRRLLDACLARAEADGLEDFDTDDLPRCQAVEELFNLGVDHGMAFPEYEERAHLVQSPGGFTWKWAGHVGRAVERHVARKREQLARAQVAAERHLFIYVHWLSTDAAGAMPGPLPSEVPPLPPEVDHVWVAALAAGSDLCVWSLTPAGWRSWPIVPGPPRDQAQPALRDRSVITTDAKPRIRAHPSARRRLRKPPE